MTGQLSTAKSQLLNRLGTMRLFPPRSAMSVEVFAALKRHRRAAFQSHAGHSGSRVWGGERNRRAIGFSDRDPSAYGELTDNWNGYGAPAPSADAIRAAKRLIRSAADPRPTRVAPSAMGGIAVEFAVADREVVAEFFNSGAAHALFTVESTGEMFDHGIGPGEAERREFLHLVREFLRG